MELKRKLERNISLFYITTIFSWGRFFIPVLALFYIASQVSFEQFTLIMGIFALATFLFEIPSGVLADLIGKKKMLVLSGIMWIIEIFLIAFFNGFWFFLVAKIISGMGVSFSSGSYEAIIYDTLKRLKREDEHKKITGKIAMISNISSAFVFIIGAWLFTIYYKLPALASLPLLVLYLIFTLFLTEPYKVEKGVTFRKSVKQFKEGFSYFWNHSYVKYLIFYSIPIFMCLRLIPSVSSVYLKDVSIPVYLIGVVVFCYSMIMAFVAKKADVIEEFLGEKKSLYLIQIVLFLSVILMSFMVSYFGALFYLMIAFVSSFSMIITNHYMNKHIESSHRATILSIRSFFVTGTLFLFYPLMGYITKIFSMSFSFVFVGVFLMIYFSWLFFYSKKLKIGKIG